jgi:hypothetical protein
VVLVGGLAACAAVLFLVDRLAPSAGDNKSPVASLDSLEGRVHSVVDSLLASHQIRKEWVKTWQVRTPDKRFIRTERRVLVPPEFVSLDFNRDLNRSLSEYGVRTVATERTKGITVTMHIMRRGHVMESLVFVMKPDLELQ